MGNGSWRRTLTKLRELSKTDLTGRYPQLNLVRLERVMRRSETAERQKPKRTTRSSSEAIKRVRGPSSDRRPPGLPGLMPKSAADEEHEVRARNRLAMLPPESGGPAWGPGADRADEPREVTSGGVSEQVEIDSDHSSSRTHSVVAGEETSDLDADTAEMPEGADSDSGSHSNSSESANYSTGHTSDESDQKQPESSDECDNTAIIEKNKVRNWREQESMTSDEDFAFTFVDFDEAVRIAGRAVAEAWAAARKAVEPNLATDAAHAHAVAVKAAKDQKEHGARKEAEQCARKNTKSRTSKMSNAASLRKPGKGTDQEKRDTDKDMFIKPLVNFMTKASVAKEANTKATEKEYVECVERRVKKLCGESEIPTLNRAVTQQRSCPDGWRIAPTQLLSTRLIA